MTSIPPFPNTPLTGTEVHYYALCPRKLWWFSHGMEQEHVTGGTGHENVEIGTQLHRDSYAGRGQREVMIDGLLRIDFTEDGKIHEIKKSRGGERAAQMQVLYYLWYLKHEKGVVTTAVIDYPKERRRLDITLTPARESEVEEAIAAAQAVKELPRPPHVPAPMPLCKNCAYQDLCWG
ncbi:CRISPR-associated protein Cas4 [Capsulimonas corticalis]|uniref:CRISPR-associated exonuclease Cas4 n=1 Tax=Capsulimonas corticalis TaxID=2219043 RepID=A0A402CWE8_9BACT|nr:CRISPR-associated protein Cas4 [Capsulimonas corticalis]BDI34140.1 CRISPR-associated protein Cas4 [Capsulimonas corticalis]